MGGGGAGKNDSFVGFVVDPDGKPPRISKPANGFVEIGAVTDESEVGTNKSRCCDGGGRGDGTALVMNGDCCWGKVELVFK